MADEGGGGGPEGLRLPKDIPELLLNRRKREKKAIPNRMVRKVRLSPPEEPKWKKKGRREAPREKRINRRNSEILYDQKEASYKPGLTHRS